MQPLERSCSAASAPAPFYEIAPSEDSRWFAEEVMPHEPRLRAWLAARFPQLRDLDDVVQEAYVRLLRARRKGPVRCAKAFLFATARNAACDVFRRQKPHLLQCVEDMAALRVLEDRPDAAEAASTHQELEILAEAMRTLPDRCRQVFTLRKVFGLSQKEIAAQLGICEHTVEIHVCRGARLCAAFLRARGVTGS